MENTVNTTTSSIQSDQAIADWSQFSPDEAERLKSLGFNPKTASEYVEAKAQRDDYVIRVALLEREAVAARTALRDARLRSNGYGECASGPADPFEEILLVTDCVQKVREITLLEDEASATQDGKLTPNGEVTE
jgi:hypothetical protein